MQKSFTAIFFKIAGQYELYIKTKLAARYLKKNRKCKCTQLNNVILLLFALYVMKFVGSEGQRRPERLFTHNAYYKQGNGL